MRFFATTDLKLQLYLLTGRAEHSFAMVLTDVTLMVTGEGGPEASASELVGSDVNWCRSLPPVAQNTY